MAGVVQKAMARVIQKPMAGPSKVLWLDIVESYGWRKMLWLVQRERPRSSIGASLLGGKGTHAHNAAPEPACAVVRIASSVFGHL